MKVSKKFSELIVSLRLTTDPEEKGLLAQLTRPLHQLSLYISLTKEIVLHTPLEHPSYRGIIKSYKILLKEYRRIENFIRRVDSHKKFLVLRRKLDWYLVPQVDLFSGHRLLLREGELYVESLGLNSKCDCYYAFLFSDILLLTKRRRLKVKQFYSGSSTDAYTYKAKPFTVIYLVWLFTSTIRIYNDFTISSHSSLPSSEWLCEYDAQQCEGVTRVRSAHIDLESSLKLNSELRAPGSLESFENLLDTHCFIEFKPSLTETCRIRLTNMNSVEDVDFSFETNACWSALLLNKTKYEIENFKNFLSLTSTSYQSIMEFLVKEKTSFWDDLFFKQKATSNGSGTNNSHATHSLKKPADYIKGKRPKNLSQDQKEEYILEIMSSFLTISARHALILDDLIQKFYLPSSKQSFLHTKKAGFCTIFTLTRSLLEGTYDFFRNTQDSFESLSLLPSKEVTNSKMIVELGSALFTHIHCIEPRYVSYAKHLGPFLEALVTSRAEDPWFNSWLKDHPISIFGEDSKLLCTLQYPSELYNALETIVDLHSFEQDQKVYVDTLNRIRNISLNINHVMQKYRCEERFHYIQRNLEFEEPFKHVKLYKEGRRLIREGVIHLELVNILQKPFLTSLACNKNEHIYAFLFNDLLLLTRKRVEKNDKEEILTTGGISSLFTSGCRGSLVSFSVGDQTRDLKQPYKLLSVISLDNITRILEARSDLTLCYILEDDFNGKIFILRSTTRAADGPKILEVNEEWMSSLEPLVKSIGHTIDFRNFPSE
jgi:hypothetical protein